MGLQGMRRRMATAVTLAAGLLVLFQDPSLASDQSHAKDLLQQTCVQCHR